MARKAQIDVLRDTGSPNFGGRFEYLAALHTFWPGMLKSLDSDVFSPSRKTWSRILNDRTTTICGLIEADKSGLLMKSRTAIRRLVHWAKEYHIVDEWMWDAALQTMHEWVGSNTQQIGWKYIARRLRLRSFQANFGVWLPADAGMGRVVTRTEFRKQATLEFHIQLDEYLNAVEAEWGTRKSDYGQLRLHAEWTAQYQSGVSFAKICDGLSGRYKDREQAVNRAIHRFKKAIGLTAARYTAK